MADEVLVVVDDHPLFRTALKVAALRAAPTATIAEAGTIAQAVERLRVLPRVDLVLLDLRIPDAVGYSGIATIHAAMAETAMTKTGRPAAPIIVVSALRAAEAAAAAVRFGAAGYLSKTAELGTIAETILDALAGRRMMPPDAGDDTEGGAVDAMAQAIADLTPAQLKVLIAVLGGRLNKQIAFDLGVSEATIKAHMTVVFRKLGVQNRTQAVIAARALGMEGEHA